MKTTEEGRKAFRDALAECQDDSVFYEMWANELLDDAKDVLDDLETAIRENAALRERAGEAERKAFNLAYGFSPLTPCLECPAFAGCKKMEARMMRGYDESKHNPCHEHRLEWAAQK